MSLYFLVISTVAAAVFVWKLLERYRNPRTCHWTVTVSVYFGWLMPFAVIYLLPMDVSSVH